MAIMSRRKQANKQGWETIKKEREESNKPKEELNKKEISEEEHQERIKTLRDLGLIKG